MASDIEICLGIQGGMSNGTAMSPEMDEPGEVWELVPGVTGKE